MRILIKHFEGRERALVLLSSLPLHFLGGVKSPTEGQLECIVDCMVNYRMLEGYAKIILPTRSDRSKTGILYIPADIVKDSSFPFNPDQEVVVRIDGRRLVVEVPKA
jgi:hypothetical protein